MLFPEPAGQGHRTAPGLWDLGQRARDRDVSHQLVCSTQTTRHVTVSKVVLSDLKILLGDFSSQVEETLIYLNVASVSTR